MDIVEPSFSEFDEDMDRHLAPFHSTLQYIRETQESIIGGQNSNASQAAQSLGNSVEGFVVACDSFRTSRSAAIWNEEGSYELRGAAVKSMFSEWLDEITEDTATLTARLIDPEILALYEQQRRDLEELHKSAQVLADP
jgi:hypothetical protein